MENKITYKEFKSRVHTQDGFGKSRRIIYYGWIPEIHRNKYYLSMIGPKEACLKVAFRLFHGENHTEFEKELIERHINTGEFKFHISYNFTYSLNVNQKIKWENGKIVEPA